MITKKILNASENVSDCFFQVVWMRNGRELKMGKKYEYVIIDRKRILMVHNVTEEDVGVYQCALADDKISLQLTLKGTVYPSRSFAPTCTVLVMYVSFL